MKAGRFEAAVASFDLALKRRSDDPHIHYNRGLALYKSGRLDEAINDFTRTLEVSPDFIFALMNRGNIYSHKGLFKDAIADYDVAILLNPAEFLLWYNRGIAKSRLGDMQGAIRDLGQAIAIKPDDTQSRLALAEIHTVQGNFSAAKAEYAMVLKIDPSDNRAVRSLAELKLKELKNSVPDIRVEGDDGKSAAAKFVDLAVASCFEHGEDKTGLEALARTLGWNPVAAAELKKNSGAASSMLAGWTFEGKSGAMVIMLSQENVTPPVHVCSLTAKMPGTETYERVRVALQLILKTSAAGRIEAAGQTMTSYWVHHTQTCEALVALVYSGHERLMTVRMLHGRNRPHIGK